MVTQTQSYTQSDPYPGLIVEKLGKRRDSIRIYKADSAIRLGVKRREIVRDAERRESDRLVQLERGPQYLAGGSNDF